MNCRSASSILLVTLLLAAPAAHASEAADVRGSGRIVLVPLSVGVRATSEVERGVGPGWREILSHFAAQNQPATALERRSAAALWNDVMAEVRAQPNPDV